MSSNECDSDVYESLKRLKKLKKEVVLLGKEAENKRREHVDVLHRFKGEIANCRKNISLVQGKLDNSKKEVSSLEKMIIPIRLGDLLLEISKLSGINVNSLKIKVETDMEFLGVHSEEEMFSLFNQNNTNYNVTLLIEGVNVNKGSIVMYITRFPLNRELKENNNGLLVEHCSIKPVNNFGRTYTKVVLDKNVEDIVLNFKLYHLDKLENYYWYPSELFTKAVINCLNKDNKKVKKIVKNK